MELTDTDKALLDAGAKAIAEDKGISLDLNNLNNGWHKKETLIIAYLSDRLHTYSDGTKTIRHADSVLFEFHVPGAYLYLAVCDAATPDEQITELAPGISLLGIGPYGDGFTINATACLPEKLRDRRIWRARNERKNAELAKGKEDAEDLISKLTSGLIVRASQEDSGTFEYLASQYLRYTLTLETVAATCVALGLDFESFVRETMKDTGS